MIFERSSLLTTKVFLQYWYSQRWISCFSLFLIEISTFVLIVSTSVVVMKLSQETAVTSNKLSDADDRSTIMISWSETKDFWDISGISTLDFKCERSVKDDRSFIDTVLRDLVITFEQFWSETLVSSWLNCSCLCFFFSRCCFCRACSLSFIVTCFRLSRSIT